MLPCTRRNKPSLVPSASAGSSCLTCSAVILFKAEPKQACWPMHVFAACLFRFKRRVTTGLETPLLRRPPVNASIKTSASVASSPDCKRNFKRVKYFDRKGAYAMSSSSLRDATVANTRSSSLLSSSGVLGNARRCIAQQIARERQS